MRITSRPSPSHEVLITARDISVYPRRDIRTRHRDIVRQALDVHQGNLNLYSFLVLHIDRTLMRLRVGVIY